MTITPTVRDASLNAQVAAEIRAWMGRREMNQADVARALGENEMWVMRRIRGRQQMTIADLHRIAGVLGTSVLDLLPPAAAEKREPSATLPTTRQYTRPTVRLARATTAPTHHRPDAHRPSARPPAVHRTARLPRTGNAAAA